MNLKKIDFLLKNIEKILKMILKKNINLFLFVYYPSKSIKKIFLTNSCATSLFLKKIIDFGKSLILIAFILEQKMFFL